MGDNLFFDMIEERGRTKEARRCVLRILERRFGAVPVHVRERIEGLSAIEKLDALQDEAIDCPSIEAFQGLIEAS